LGTLGAQAKADFCFGDAFCLADFSKTHSKSFLQSFFSKKRPFFRYNREFTAKKRKPCKRIQFSFYKAFLVSIIQ